MPKRSNKEWEKFTKEIFNMYPDNDEGDLNATGSFGRTIQEELIKEVQDWLEFERDSWKFSNKKSVDIATVNASINLIENLMECFKERFEF